MHNTHLYQKIMRTVRDIIIFLSLDVLLFILSVNMGSALGSDRSSWKEPELVYSSTDPTSQDVIVTLQSEQPITITNTGGLDSFTFSQNGRFVFEYLDNHGNTQELEAVVTNIDKIPPQAIFRQTPASKTQEINAHFEVGGTDVAVYRYKLDDKPWELACPVSNPIDREDMTFGVHTIVLIGSDAVGNWQPEAEATAYTWEIEKTDTNRPRVTPLEPGKEKLIEVSIEEQHMWVYEGKTVIYHTAVTTGANGMSTDLGSFAISQKHLNKWFEGGFFSKYWMRFNGGMGIHDANWRKQFGTEDYKWRGSHGCVNVPFEAAEWLYAWTEIGTPVVVL